jgi:hypothetical protein
MPLILHVSASWGHHQATINRRKSHCMDLWVNITVLLLHVILFQKCMLALPSCYFYVCCSCSVMYNIWLSMSCLSVQLAPMDACMCVIMYLCVLWVKKSWKKLQINNTVWSCRNKQLECAAVRMEENHAIKGVLNYGAWNKRNVGRQ